MPAPVGTPQGEIVRLKRGLRAGPRHNAALRLATAITLPVPSPPATAATVQPARPPSFRCSIGAAASPATTRPPSTAASPRTSLGASPAAPGALAAAAAAHDAAAEAAAERLLSYRERLHALDVRGRTFLGSADVAALWAAAVRAAAARLRAARADPRSPLHVPPAAVDCGAPPGARHGPPVAMLDDDDDDDCVLVFS